MSSYSRKGFQGIGVLLLVVFVIGCCTVKQEESNHMDQSALVYLTEIAKDFLRGCQRIASDGTILYTPDKLAFYGALWTRDFAYMVENAGDLMPEEHIEGCIRYLIRGQRADGAIPDRVRCDGVAVYSAGPEEQPLGEPNLDNPPFLVFAVDAYLKRVSPDRQKALFHEWSTCLDKGMRYVPLSEKGLVYNDASKPHSPYGFTDTVCKTGELFMESLLYWDACQRLAFWFKKFDNDEKAKDYRAKAARIEKNIDILWNDKAGAFWAATQDCRQIDIWGNAYAIYIKFPLKEKREAILRFLVENYPRYVWCGQVRHLLKEEYWERMLLAVPKGEYQNGAYWATASGWVMVALTEIKPELARQMLTELVSDFQTYGVYECINENNRKLEGYVVSITNPLGALRLLSATK